MRNRNKILHVLGRLDVGGVQSHVLDILRHSDKDRFCFDVCEMSVKPGVLTDKARELGANVLQCSLRNNPLTYYSRFSSILKAGNYDVIHLHRYDMSAIPLLIAAKCGIKNRIVHYHNVKRFDPTNPAYYLSGFLKSINQKYATSICGCSQDVLNSHFGNTDRLDKRFVVVYNSVDSKKNIHNPESRTSVRRELGIPDDAILVGNCARLTLQKDPIFFVESAIEIIRQNDNIFFLWVGSGDLEEPVRRMVFDAGLANRIILTGVRQDAPELMSAMDILFSPSRWEGFCITVAEAQACGLPVIASMAGAFAESICPELQCFRVECGDINTAVKNILTLAQDESLREVLGNNGKEYVSKFDVKKIVNQLEGLYSMHESRARQL